MYWFLTWNIYPYGEKSNYRVFKRLQRQPATVTFDQRHTHIHTHRSQSLHFLIPTLTHKQRTGCSHTPWTPTQCTTCSTTCTHSTQDLLIRSHQSSCLSQTLITLTSLHNQTSSSTGCWTFNAFGNWLAIFRLLLCQLVLVHLKRDFILISSVFTTRWWLSSQSPLLHQLRHSVLLHLCLYLSR